jgi:hypothetical protein
MKKSVIASLLLACSAWSQATPTVALSFTQPTAAEIGAHDSIPLWVTLSVAPGNADFVFDPTSSYPWGFLSSDIPTYGFDSSFANHAFTSYTGATLSFGEDCTGGTATSMVCSASPYGFAQGPGFQSIADASGAVHIAAGTSTSVLVGTFIPNGSGGVPGETYSFYNASIALIVTGKGLDASGNSVDLTGYAFMNPTCPTLDASCSFTRTIAAVPEPTHAALFALGLGAIAWSARRRRNT